MYDDILDASFFKMRQQTLHVLSLGISAFGTSWQTQAKALLQIRSTLWTFLSSTSQSFDQSMMVLLFKTRAYRQIWEMRIHLTIVPAHQPLLAVRMALQSHITILYCRHSRRKAVRTTQMGLLQGNCRVKVNIVESHGREISLSGTLSRLRRNVSGSKSRQSLLSRLDYHHQTHLGIKTLSLILLEGLANLLHSSSTMDQRRSRSSTTTSNPSTTG